MESLRTMYPTVIRRAPGPRGTDVSGSNSQSGARVDAMVNRCERVINVVNPNQPTLLTGWSQTALEWVVELADFHAWAPNTPGEEHGPTASSFHRRNMGSPLYSRMGRNAGRQTDGAAGTGRWRKRRPCCNGTDKGAPHGNVTLQETGQTSTWSLITRALDEPTEEVSR